MAEPKTGSTMSQFIEAFGSPQEAVFALGIDGETGGYFRRPVSAGDFAWRRNGQPVRPGGTKETRVGVSPDDLASAGWGVLFADDGPRKALAPLLELRRRQAGERYAEYRYQPDQTAQAFLNGQGAGPGPADPERAPYYLTIVGGPETVPFEFQQELDIRYAVGRIAFDRAEDYARYARAVVAAENGKLQRSRTSAFFAVEHAGDPVTRQCVEKLVEPVVRHAVRPGWGTQTVYGNAATGPALRRILEGSERPALLLTAAHSLVWPSGHELQSDYQGGILTAEWPGPTSEPGPVSKDQVFAADDLGDAADVGGMVAVLVGCFTAGTPRLDAFDEDGKKELAPAPFVAEFPQRLLARGALAAVGHVDSLYLHSFVWPGAGGEGQFQTFEALLYHLMEGRRLGHAMDAFGRRYGELAARLLAARLDPGKVPAEEYSSYWIGYHDARQYVILGDPAVRLALADEG